MGADRGISGRTALVTGGVQGIGRACALALAREGGRIAVFDLAAPDSAAASELCNELAACGGAHTYVQVDVTQGAEVERGLNTIRAALGAPDILVNNAGKGRNPVALEALEDDEWDAVVALNLKAAMLCSRAVIQDMKQRGWGRIINMSSIAGRGRGELAHIAYASAKAGVLGFTRQLACEAGPWGITVNAVAPGATLSGRVAERWAERDEAARRKMTEAIPLRRIGRPEEVAGAVVFLASEDASYITGATLDVNGGRYF